jgi:hypothetical protein
METTNTMNIADLVGSIKDWDTWVVLLIVAAFGLLGGLAHKLTSPPEDKTSSLRYMLVGIVASLAVLFVFTPSDAVRLIALSLAAGYGGKAVLDALEARVKVALAKEETARAKKDGQKALEAGKEAVRHAQKLSQINKELEKALMEATKQTRETILGTLTAPLPGEVHSFVAKSPEVLADELKQLSYKLESLEEAFRE